MSTDHRRDTIKEKLKTNLEYMKIGIVLVLSIGTGVLGILLTQIMTIEKTIATYAGFVIFLIIVSYIFVLFKENRTYLEDLEKL